MNISPKQIAELLVEHIDSLLLTFNLEYNNTNDTIRMSCPIHEGDNKTSLCIYINTGYWMCFSHQCHHVFRCDLLGFVQAMLSKTKYGWLTKNDKIVSIDDTIKWSLDFMNMKNGDIQYRIQQIEKKKFYEQFYVSHNDTIIKPKITRQNIIQSLQIPSKYYIQRGINQQILKKYDVGDCFSINKPMYKRAVVPVYDETHQYMIGCTGRSINGIKPKWKHSEGFKSHHYFYNLWFAKPYIQKSHIAILVEGPGDVWKLEEFNIHNSLALFGCHISDMQIQLLNTLGVLSLIIIMDNDEAGQKACNQMIKQLKKLFRIYTPTISKNDLGDMTQDEITVDIAPLIEQTKQVYMEINT